MSEQNTTYDQRVIATFCDALAEGKSVLQQNYPTAPSLLPMNTRGYASYNALYLAEKMREKNSLENRFTTPKQAQEVGAEIREGAEPIEVATWLTNTGRRAERDENGEIKRDEEGKPFIVEYDLERPRCKTAVVYHASEIDNMPDREEEGILPISAEALKAHQDRAAKNIEAILGMAERGENTDLIQPFLRSAKAYQEARDNAPPVGSLDDKKRQFQGVMADYLTAAELRAPFNGRDQAQVGQDLAQSFRDNPCSFFQMATAAEATKKLVVTLGQDKPLEQILAEEKERRDAQAEQRNEYRRNRTRSDNDKPRFPPPGKRDYLHIPVFDKEAQSEAKALGARFDGVRRDPDGNETTGPKLWCVEKDKVPEALQPYKVTALDGVTFENRESIKALAKENGGRLVWNMETQTMFAVGTTKGLEQYVSPNQDIEARLADAQTMLAERAAREERDLQNRQYLCIAPFNQAGIELAKENGARFAGNRGKNPGPNLWYVDKDKMPEELQQFKLIALQGVDFNNKDAVKELAQANETTIVRLPQTERWYAVGSAKGLDAYLAPESDQDINKHFEQAQIAQKERDAKQKERDANTKIIDCSYKEFKEVQELGAANNIAVWYDREDKCYKARGEDLENSALANRISADQNPSRPDKAPTPKKEFASKLNDKDGKEPVMDGKPHEFTNKANEKGTYQVDQNGKGVIQTNKETRKVMHTGHTVTPEAKENLEQASAADKEAAQIDQEAAREKAMKAAYGKWKNMEAAPGQDNPHIKADKNGNTVYPAFNLDNGLLQTLHTYTPDEKHFSEKGCPRKDGVLILGGPQGLKKAEQYAVVADPKKAQEMHAEKGIPVVIAFDEKAVGPLEKKLADKYPDKKNALAATQQVEKGGAER